MFSGQNDINVNMGWCWLMMLDDGLMMVDDRWCFTPSTFPNHPSEFCLRIQVKLVLGFQINRDPQMKDERTAESTCVLCHRIPAHVNLESEFFRTKLGAMARTADLVEEMGQVWPWQFWHGSNQMDPWIWCFVGQLCFLRQDGNPHRKWDGLCTLLRGDTMKKSSQIHQLPMPRWMNQRFDTVWHFGTLRCVMKTKMLEIWATSEWIPSWPRRRREQQTSWSWKGAGFLWSL